MELQYQRGEIQSDSLKYERLRHSGELPIIGVNTFLPRDPGGDAEAARHCPDPCHPGRRSKRSIERLAEFHDPLTPSGRRVPSSGCATWPWRAENLFAELMAAVAGVCSWARSPGPSTPSAASTGATSDLAAPEANRVFGRVFD